MMRLLLVILFIPAIVSFIRSMGVQSNRLRASDVFAFLFVLWTILAIATTEGIDKASVSGTLIWLETIGGYMIVRAFFKEREDIKFFVRCFAGAMVVIISIAVFDHLMGRNSIAAAFSSMMGSWPPSNNYRNGLLRATSTLDHPILYGTTCAFAGVILYYGIEGARRMMYLMFCVFGCFLGMSSAPLLSASFTAMIMVYDRLLESYPWRWRVLLGSIAAAVLLLCIVKDDPVATLVRNLTLDAQTGFYRLLIWRYAGAEVLNAPWVGIGFRDWARVAGMNNSVDALWLAFALTAGIPVAVLYGLLLLTAMHRSGPHVNETLLDPYLVRLGRGLSIVLSIMIVVGFTVHFWGSVLTFLGALIGLKTTIEEMRARQTQVLLRASRQARSRLKSTRAPFPELLTGSNPAVR